MLKLAILGSTRGSNLIPIAEAIRNQQLPATIEMVISNKKDAGILEKAVTYQMPFRFVDPTHLSRDAYDQEISKLLTDCQIDCIVLIGYMRILSAAFVNTWRDKIINVHPSLLPAFAGLMDLAVHRAVLAAGDTQTGCTVHQVTEEVDAGPILVQLTCPVLATDTPETLKRRVQQLEGPALIQAIQQLSDA